MLTDREPYRRPVTDKTKAATKSRIAQSSIPQFDDHVCVGDSVTWKRDGFDLTAVIARDEDARPQDYEGYTPEQVEAWKANEWFFCSVGISVSRNGVVLDEWAASLCGLACNLIGNNKYLATVADELEREALDAARKAMARIKEALA